MKMDIKLIVPGHGKAISKIEAIKPMMNYFDRLIEQVRNFHVNNRSLQESINSILQKKFSILLRLIKKIGCFSQNITTLMLLKHSQSLNGNKLN